MLTETTYTTKRIGFGAGMTKQCLPKTKSTSRCYDRMSPLRSSHIITLIANKKHWVRNFVLSNNKNHYKVERKLKLLICIADIVPLDWSNYFVVYVRRCPFTSASIPTTFSKFIKLNNKNERETLRYDQLTTASVNVVVGLNWVPSRKRRENILTSLSQPWTFRKEKISMRASENWRRRKHAQGSRRSKKPKVVGLNSNSYLLHHREWIWKCVQLSSWDKKLCHRRLLSGWTILSSSTIAFQISRLEALASEPWSIPQAAKETSTVHGVIVIVRR